MKNTEPPTERPIDRIYPAKEFLTLLDHFAAAALPEVIAGCISTGGQFNTREVAELAYEAGLEMVRVRETYK
jgi:hypothetical protein